MLIRKLFKFDGQHIVRNCSSERCRKSIHAHTYTVEVKFTADKLDSGGMILDFGLTKSTIGGFIKSFHKSYSMWSLESSEFKKFKYSHTPRWVEMPVSPSAEQYALLFLFVIDKILKATKFANNEGNVKLFSVVVHETSTGYAEAFYDDLNMVDYRLEDIIFSAAIKNAWVDPLMYNKLINAEQNGTKIFINSTPKHQIYNEI